MEKLSSPFFQTTDLKTISFICDIASIFDSDYRTYRCFLPLLIYFTFYFIELSVNLSYLCKQCKRQKRQLSVLPKSLKITMQMWNWPVLFSCTGKCLTGGNIRLKGPVTQRHTWTRKTKTKTFKICRIFRNMFNLQCVLC